METAIAIVWWVGLVGALIPTVIVLKLVLAILRVLGDIHRLGAYIRDAARGIAAHTRAVSHLAEAEPHLAELERRSRELAGAAGAVEQRLEVLAAEAAEPRS